MKKVYLHDGWKFSSYKTGVLDATVPGCVHTDLARHGVIGDLFWRDNNKDYQWIEDLDFDYSLKFDAKVGKKVYLCFEGLDTYCKIYLNNCFLGSAENMFIPHEFDVSALLKEKDNILLVKFRSCVKEVEGLEERSHAFTAERLNTRRIQCTYGWDWVDRFVTTGVYRPVYLKYADDMYVENAYVCTENIDAFSAGIYTEFEFKNAEIGSMVKVQILDPNGIDVAHTEFFCKENLAVRRFDIKNPMLWYPNGYGEHPLYTLKVTVGDNIYTDTFGIRTIKILQLTDEKGSEYYKKAEAMQKTFFGKQYSHNEEFKGFKVLVNGVEIFCMGGNWVPCEPYPSAETKEKFATLIKKAVDMGANFLRVWGGGLFEQDDFYYECDKNGILVAQDFLMACGHYPEKEDWFIEELKKESLFAVKKLRNHPSLAWWHGDNENAVDGSDTDTDYTGRDTAYKGIAPNIYKYDKTRQFLPSSPYGGSTYASLTQGTCHNSNYCYDIFAYFHKEACDDYKTFFENFCGRFVSEEPTFGAVARSSMLKFMTLEDIYDEKEEILKFHTKNNPCLDRHMYDDISEFTAKVLGEFKNGEDRYFKYKYIQYEWIRAIFENDLKNLDYCNGLIFWMFNDCWPAALGWSFVDYYCLPKSSYYIFKRLAKKVTATVNKKDKAYTVTVTNKGTETKTVSGIARVLDIKNGFSEVAYEEFTVNIKPYSVCPVQLKEKYNKNYLVVVDVSCDDYTDRCFYKDGALHIANATDNIEVVEKTENSITIKAKEYTHAVEFEGQFVFSDNYFSLLKDEVKTITFTAFNNPENADFTVTAYTL